MKRGELYRVSHPTVRDPKKYRVFVIVSRQVLIDSRFSTVICAPIYTAYDGLATQVPMGPDEGFKHESSVHCDEASHSRPVSRSVENERSASALRARTSLREAGQAHFTKWSRAKPCEARP
jgi:mRNA interferase MazF